MVGIKNLAFIFLVTLTQAQIILPSYYLSDVPLSTTLKFPCPIKRVYLDYEVYNIDLMITVANGTLQVNETTSSVNLDPLLLKPFKNRLHYIINMGYLDSDDVINLYNTTQEVYSLPGWVSLFPAISAVFLVFFLRNALLGLFIGCWMGIFLYNNLNPLTAFFDVFGKHIINTTTDRGNALIIIFIFLLGAQTGLMRKTGGFPILSQYITKIAYSSRIGQIIGWIIGVLVSVSAYMSIFVTASCISPIYEALNISREKLAFLVDATSGPAVSMFPFSTYTAVATRFLGAELEYLGIERSPYLTYLEAIPRFYYQIYLLFFVLFTSATGFDFASMYEHEYKARRQSNADEDSDNTFSLANEKSSNDEDKMKEESILLNDEENCEQESLNTDKAFLPKDNKPKRAINAVLPLIIFVIVIVISVGVEGFYAAERQDLEISFQTIISSADVSVCLLWGSSVCILLVTLLLLVQRILTVKEITDTFVAGMKTGLEASFILLLAWTLTGVCKLIKLDLFISTFIGGFLPSSLLPLFTLIISGFMSFVTGTSYGTQALMFPIIVPLTQILAPGDERIFLESIASIISGSNWGDNCSPISDTVLLSALAAGVPPEKHARTQFPYALIIGIISAIFGNLFVGMGFYEWYVALPIGFTVISLMVILVGKRPGIYNKKTNKIGSIQTVSFAGQIVIRLQRRFTFLKCNCSCPRLPFMRKENYSSI